MIEASVLVPIRVIACCLMPNHFHLVLQPHGDGDLSQWMHWLMTTHVRRYLRHYHDSSQVWQSRFKPFKAQDDEHLVAVVRYVERNPSRARLAVRAESWPWSSLGGKSHGLNIVSQPLRHCADWLEFVNTPMIDGEIEALHISVIRDRPFGSEAWTAQTAQRLSLMYMLRRRGRSSFNNSANQLFFPNPGII